MERIRQVFTRIGNRYMERKIKQHGMKYTASVGDAAVDAVTHFLETYWPQTVAVHNVEHETDFQQFDVDLLWTVANKHGRLRTIPIEVKGDRYHRTGNFFFETVSNASKGTPGCFLYTGATWLFYYFVEIDHLYCLPMNVIRPWFHEQMEQFPERETSTPVGSEHYITIGRLVPIDRVLEEVEGVQQYRRQQDEWLLLTGIG